MFKLHSMPIAIAIAKTIKTMAMPNKQSTVTCHVVAMPFPGRGNINPMLNLCTALAEYSSDIIITFVVTEEWLGLIGSVSKPPNISFASIPNVVPSEKVRGNDTPGFGMAVLTKMEEPFERLLDELPLPSPAVIIADAFLTWAGDVAHRRNIPLAFMWTMSASVYTIFYHFDLLVKSGQFPVNLSENGDDIVDYIPGLSPLRISDLPKIIRDQEFISMFLTIMPKYSKSKYLLFSCIYELESKVFDMLKEKSAFSIYNLGPSTSNSKVKQIISDRENSCLDQVSKNFTTDSQIKHKDDKIMKWLDLQPHNSVLYISQGSFLSISTLQMDEIALALHKTSVRYLWVSRNESSRLQEICGDNGLVVEWCDQLSVLCHPSIVGFWTHCGWNSTKDAVLAGVPMLTFPIVLDQLPNAKAIVDDWKVGWRVKREFDEGNLATCDEIARIVQRFMDLESPERKELLRNARELQKVCEREFADGESFQTNLHGFIESIMQDSLCQL